MGNLEHIQKAIIDQLILEFVYQGHSMNGSWESKLIGEIIESMDRVVISVYGPKHSIYVNNGVSADKIPFTPPGWPTAKKNPNRSLYIEGLQRYAKFRFGLTNEKEALGAAFAIAKKHKAYGMPTAGSYRFSRTGKRTDFVDETLKNLGQNELFIARVSTVYLRDIELRLIDEIRNGNNISNGS